VNLDQGSDRDRLPCVRRRFLESYLGDIGTIPVLGRLVRRPVRQQRVAGGMTSFLFERKIRIFDHPKFAEPFRNRIRENAEQMAADAGIQIEFIRKRNFRKEDRVKQILAR
jgi:hypothetical protein